MRDVFKLSTLRGAQLEAIKAVLDKHDTFVVMPTGSGKSLIYMLSAVVQKGVTFVISPLLALIHNQVDVLHALKVSAQASYLQITH